MPTEEDIAQQKVLLSAYRRTLAHYLKQLAILGFTQAPPGLMYGIYETRESIRHIKTTLRDWGVAVEDHPDDSVSQEIYQETSLKILDVHLISERNKVIDFRSKWLNETKQQLQNDLFSANLFPIVDIKIKNSCPFPLLLTKMTFNVRRIESFPAYGAETFPISWEYTVLFDAEKELDNLEIRISQLVKPNDVDRFIIVIGQEGFVGSAEYEFTMKIHYDESLIADAGTHRVKIGGSIHPHNPVIRKLPQRGGAEILKRILAIVDMKSRRNP